MLEMPGTAHNVKRMRMRTINSTHWYYNYVKARILGYKYIGTTMKTMELRVVERLLPPKSPILQFLIAMTGQ